MMADVPDFPIRNTRVVSRTLEILRLCADKKVLHLGCADVPFTLQRGENLLHYQLARVTPPHKLWGLDLSKEGVNILQQKGHNVIHGDVEQLGRELKEQDFDVILAGEIIEHLSNPGLFLKSLTSVMNRNTELVLTTVNASPIKGFLRTMMRRERVHPDHNYYFSYRTIQQLLEKFDLKCTEVYYYQGFADGGFWRIVDKTLSIATWISPACADGLIVRATI